MGENGHSISNLRIEKTLMSDANPLASRKLLIYLCLQSQIFSKISQKPNQNTQKSLRESLFTGVWRWLPVGPTPNQTPNHHAS